MLCLSRMICLLPCAFCGLGFALQAVLGAGTENFQDIRGRASSHSCWLFPFKVPLSPFLLLALFFEEHRLQGQERAAGCRAGSRKV